MKVNEMKNDFNSTYKRLTRRDENKIAELIDEDVDIEAAEQNALNRLAELEDMIEDGGLLFAPVRVGDKIQFNDVKKTCKGLYFSDEGWVLNIDDNLYRITACEEKGFMFKPLGGKEVK